MIDNNNLQDNRQRIAVVGAGISGITAAWLLSGKHDVTLIEKEPRLGGHAHTHTIESGCDAGTNVDMGFIVLNDRNYPTLLKLFEQWQVNVQDSDMSFGFADHQSGFYYSSDVPGGLFARRKNIISLQFWKLIRDIFRFNRIALNELDNGLENITLGEFLNKYGFSKAYIDYHIVPVSAAVWSTPDNNILDFPIESIIRFYNHHGLLALTNRPQWKTVVGGSISYIQAFEKRFKGQIIKANPAISVKRSPDKVNLVLQDNSNLEFDSVVLATHANISRQILADPEQSEAELLEKWSYTPNNVTLHSDINVMPPKRKAWASWNYTKLINQQDKPMVNMSYYMNRLQKLDSEKDYFVTLNSDNCIDSKQQVKSVLFDHPCYTFDSLSTHKDIDSINGKNRIYFCGAYCGYGFHEDGARSGLKVAEKFGISL